MLPAAVTATSRAAADARPIALAVDGGITPETAARVLAAGADTLIAGTSVFGAPDRAAAIAGLRGAGPGDPSGGRSPDTTSPGAERAGDRL